MIFQKKINWEIILLTQAQTQMLRLGIWKGKYEGQYDEEASIGFLKSNF